MDVDSLPLLLPFDFLPFRCRHYLPSPLFDVPFCVCIHLPPLHSLTLTLPFTHSFPSCVSEGRRRSPTKKMTVIKVGRDQTHWSGPAGFWELQGTRRLDGTVTLGDCDCVANT